ncbi:MAG: AAA family ATPase [Candidatus Paceibacteria bacterium]
MRLESITLQGFKSFAEETTLEFLSPDKQRKSITAIVGPNGSGKSNISDAIRWVMGEQSLSKLRAKTNEDIIFNGSDGTRRAGRASVEIILDNSDRVVDIDQDSISLERRYYRSGESQYIINGEEVRLMDLKLLLAKANFAQSSYSVVGQGMVNNIVVQTPKERKEFFDEAFGIKQYQIKRHKAWLKLNRTEDNIQELELLLKEKQPRLSSLKKKVEKLEEKKEIQLKLTELRESYYGSLFERNEDEISSLESQLEQLNTKEKEINKKIEDHKQKLAELAKNDSNKDFDRLQKKHQKIVNEKNKLEEEKAVLQGKLQTEYSQAGNKNISWIESKIEDLKEDKREVSGEIEDLKGDIDQASGRIEEKKEKLSDVEYKKSALEGKISKIKQQLSTTSSSTGLTSIKAIDQLIKNKNKFDGLFGALAQLGSVEDKFRLAVDIAAGSHLNSLVVQNEDTAQSCIQYLKQNRLGYATFLPLQKLNPRIVNASKFNHPKVYDLALDLVSFDEKYRQAFEYALGSTLVVEDVQTAKELGIGRVRMVTLDGDVLNKSGSITGGHRSSKNRKVSFSMDTISDSDDQNKKQKLKQLQEQLEELQEKEDKLHKKISDLKAKKQKKESKKEMMVEKKEVIEQEIDELKSDLDLAQMDPEEYSENLEQLRGRKEELNQQISELDSKAEQLKQKIEQFNKQEEKKKEEIFSLQDKLQEQQLELKDLQNEISQKQKKKEKLKTKQEDIKLEVENILNCNISDILDKGFERIQYSEKDDVRDQIQELKYKLDLIGEIDPSVKSEYEELKQECEDLKTQLSDLNQAMEDSKELIRELDKKMKQKREESFSKIKEEFHNNFQTLFGGGEASLNRVYGEKEEQIEGSEEAIVGVKIEASPPDKKVDNIRALSGGEKTLTALALICAIIKTNPSPFIVLDEVEASLDETNTSKFINILEDLAEESQFILITHNRTTMHAADALYGVTMNSGVSEIVSLDLQQAEQVSEEPEVQKQQ